jgi:hypothetical protein
MLVAGQAAHGRRVQAESGSAAYFPVDHRRKHLALKAREGGIASKVKVRVQAVEERSELQVDKGDAEDSRHHAAIPPLRHSYRQSAQAARLFGINSS